MRFLYECVLNSTVKLRINQFLSYLILSLSLSLSPLSPTSFSLSLLSLSLSFFLSLSLSLSLTQIRDYSVRDGGLHHVLFRPSTRSGASQRGAVAVSSHRLCSKSTLPQVGRKYSNVLLHSLICLSKQLTPPVRDHSCGCVIVLVDIMLLAGWHLNVVVTSRVHNDCYSCYKHILRIDPNKSGIFLK